MCSAKDRYTLIEQSSNYRITCMQYSQKNFMRIIGNGQKNNGQNFWDILERIIGKILSIIGAGLTEIHFLSLRVSYIHGLSRDTKYLTIDGQVCFYRWHLPMLLNQEDAFLARP